MYKDHRNVCPKCGSDKIKKLRQGLGKPIMPRVYWCPNGHSTYTGDVIPKYKFKKGKNV